MSSAPVPAGYGALTTLKAEVRTAQPRARRVVNIELLTLYWTIGDAIVAQQAAAGWGTGVIDRLADDLRAEFPDMCGLGRSNVHYMRSMASAWTRSEVVQQNVGQLPWGHVTVLLDKLDDKTERDWYAAATVEHGWSRNVLLNQTTNRLHTRTSTAGSNFGGAAAGPRLKAGAAADQGPVRLRFPRPHLSRDRVRRRAGTDGPRGNHDNPTPIPGVLWCLQEVRARS